MQHTCIPLQAYKYQPSGKRDTVRPRRILQYYRPKQEILLIHGVMTMMKLITDLNCMPCDQTIHRKLKLLWYQMVCVWGGGGDAIPKSGAVCMTWYLPVGNRPVDGIDQWELGCLTLPYVSHYAKVVSRRIQTQKVISKFYDINRPHTNTLRYWTTWRLGSFRLLWMSYAHLVWRKTGER
jgi:hypothetical protein